MKKSIHKYSPILRGLMFSVVVLIICSCSKNTTNPVVPTGQYWIHLHTAIDSSEVDSYNMVYGTSVGRKMSLSMAQLYISDIQLVKLDGSTVSMTGKKLLKVFETESYLVGDAPVGNYKSIRFKVGLDAATNALSPTTPSDSAILNKPEMWLNSTAQPDGYVFMNVQGTIDTSAAFNKPLVPFVYKIGTNAHYTQVTMADNNFSITENQATYSHIHIDYSQLFNGVQLNQLANLSVKTASANSTTIATKISNNISSMFVYE